MHHTRGDQKNGTVAAGYGCPRVSISMTELRSYEDGKLSQQMRMDPLPHIRALEQACYLVATEERPGYDKEGKAFDFLVLLTVCYAPCLDCCLPI